MTLTMSNPNSPPSGGRKAPPPRPKRPEWTDGLRRLYDSVVDEPLPDSFQDLLDRLDKQN